MKVIEHLKSLSDEQFLALYQALEQNGFGPLDAEVAKSLRFRPQAVRKLPMPQRARRARMIVERASNAELCYELFGAYLMKHCKELVTGFLDATGVPHEEGMIEDLEQTPDSKKVKESVAKLDAEFAADDVTLYLSMCADQWPTVAELEAIWRERLEAGAEA